MNNHREQEKRRLNRYDIEDLRKSAYDRIKGLCIEEDKKDLESKKRKFDEICCIVRFVEAVITEIEEREKEENEPV